MEEYTLNLTKEEMELVRSAIISLDREFTKFGSRMYVNGDDTMDDYLYNNTCRIEEIKRKIRNTGMRV